MYVYHTAAAHIRAAIVWYQSNHKKYMFEYSEHSEYLKFGWRDRKESNMSRIRLALYLSCLAIVFVIIQ
jgi:hypothetical protein